MQPLDLYASIEESLDFSEEIQSLYEAIALKVIKSQTKDLIDIGCGQGEFCRLLEVNGISTYGVDLSKKQIQIAKSKGLNVQAIDIKDIDKKFNCATAVFDVVNYLNDDYIESFFTNVSRVLNKNGLFIFDINSLHGFEDIAQGVLTIDEENRFIAIDAVFQNNTLFTKIDLFTKEKQLFKKDTGTIKQYYHSMHKIKEISKKTGFKFVSSEGFNLHSDECDKYIITLEKE